MMDFQKWANEALGTLQHCVDCDECRPLWDKMKEHYKTVEVNSK